MWYSQVFGCFLSVVVKGGSYSFHPKSVEWL